MNGVNSWFCFRGSRIFCTSQYHLWLWLSIQISVSDFKNQVAWTSCSEINSLTSYHSPNINFVSSLVLSYSCLLWNTRGDSDFFNCIFHFDKSVPIACKCIFQQFRISWRKNVYQNKKRSNFMSRNTTVFVSNRFSQTRQALWNSNLRKTSGY